MTRVSTSHEVSQRDLRMRSREIMDDLERGRSFTVTRDGRPIGELVPRQVRRRFVSSEEFAARSRMVPAVDIDAFRGDLDAAVDPGLADPYGA